MPRSRALPARAVLALALAGAADPAAARAADASPWARSAQSEARLLDGGSAPDGRLLAGVEIRLAPQFITYWRDPGEAGVPPSFSFAGSTNLRSATVRYPAPTRIDEAGTAAYGYAGDVVFPVAIEPADPGRPVVLALKLDYATCHDVCLPARVELGLTLDGASSGDAARVGEALAAVPRPSTVGGGGTPTVRSVAAAPDGGFSVATSGTGQGAALFVEAPEGWAYGVGTPQLKGGDAVFPVKRLDGPRGAVVPAAPVRLTLTAPSGAVEVETTLDGDPPKP